MCQVGNFDENRCGRVEKNTMCSEFIPYLNFYHFLSLHVAKIVYKLKSL